MIHWNPNYIILLGFFLVFMGFLLPFLMVLRIIEPNFPISFLSFTSSVAGLYLGLIGLALYRSRQK